MFTRNFSLPFLFFFCLILVSLDVYSQKMITGTVTDKKNETIPGASIKIKGTNTGAVTDINGKFKLTIPNEKTILVVSFIGYSSQEITVGDKETFNIILSEDVHKLEEFVAVGYGTMKKSDITGAVATVVGEDVQKMLVSNIDQALQGKASGVDISSNSGSPGANVTIRIRGTGTINNANPIFVIDGMVMDPSAVNFLNPSDIEDVSVLKDASAAAIYGAQGANGVIMITTKKGKSGPPKLSVNGYFGWQKASHWMKLTNGPDYARIKNLRAVLSDTLPLYSDPDNLPTTNWFKEISQTAPIYNFNASVTGGSDKSTYLFSTSYFGQQGIIKTSDYNRITVRMNNEFKILKWLKIGENFQVASSKRSAVNENAAYNTPVTEAMNYDPITTSIDKNGDFGSGLSGEGGNPLAHLLTKVNLTTYKDIRLVGNGYGEITFLKDFTFRSTLGYEYDFSEYRRLTPPYKFHGADINLNSKLENGWYKSTHWQWENYLTYKKTFKGHDITFMGGTSAAEYQYYNIVGRNSSGPTVNDPTLQYFDNYQHGNNQDALNGTADQSSLFSLIGRLNYGFKDRYLATLTIRRDGSSKFGPNFRYGNFPSAALAWKVTNERFMKNIPILSSLKLRFGWGKIGNEKIPTGQYLGFVAVGDIPYTFNGVTQSGTTILTYPNKDIHWETTTQTNIGFDAGFFKNRLLIDAEYFDRKTTDMLAPMILPAISGVPQNQFPTGNIGTISNKGFEVSAYFQNVEGAVRYKVGGNFTKVVNKVISIGAADFISEGSYGQGFTDYSRTEVNHQVGMFYGYKTEGIFKDYAEINTHAFQSAGTQPGDIKFKDLNGDGLISDADRTIIGNPNPKFTYGFNAEVSYMNFDLSLSFQGVYGNDILAMWKTWNYTVWNDSRNYHADVANAWTPENQSNYARVDGSGDLNGNSTKLSDYYIEKGSYLRLKNLQLGYSLPKKVCTKIKIDGLRIYVAGQNLFTFTKYKGNDPEIGLPLGNNSGSYNNLIIGVDYGIVPQPRIFSIGFNINF